MSTMIKFLVSNIEIDGKIPVKLINECCFRKARTGDIKIIQESLDRSISHNKFIEKINFIVPYKYLFRINNDNKLSYKELPSKYWRYYVISSDRSNCNFNEIEKISSLLSKDLDFGFSILYNKKISNIMTIQSIPSHIVEIYNSILWKPEPPAILNSSELKRINEIHGKINDLDKEKYEFIINSIDNLYQIKRITRLSDLITVGYFSILESLVTHKPRLSESLDSINHQVVNKLILLTKKFDRTINQSDYFNADTPEDTVWKKLYSYRSCIAHGGKADFNSSLQVLKSRISANDYLREVIKELILLGINDPSFLFYLKKC